MNSEPSQQQLPVNYAREVLEEIRHTEQKYVGNLYLLDRVFVRPIQQHIATEKKPVLSDVEFKQMFGSLQTILMLNHKFLLDLEERYSADGVKSHVGDLFLKYMDFFKQYTPYAEHYPQAQETLVRLRRKKGGLGKLLQKCAESEPLGGLTIDDLLIMPIQRIPRYVMLLRALAKSVSADTDAAEATRVAEAADGLHAIAAELNEKKRAAENLGRVLQIQAAIVGAVSYLAEPHRRLVCEEDLIDMSKQRRTYPTRCCFLFSDRLVVVKPKGARLKFKWEIDLVNANVSVLPPSPATPNGLLSVEAHRQPGEAPLMAKRLAPITRSAADWRRQLCELISRLQSERALRMERAESVAEQKANNMKAFVGHRYASMRAASLLEREADDGSDRSGSGRDRTDTDQAARVSVSVFAMAVDERLSMIDEKKRQLGELRQREEEQAEQAEAKARLRVEKNLGMIEERYSKDLSRERHLPRKTSEPRDAPPTFRDSEPPAVAAAPGDEAAVATAMAEAAGGAADVAPGTDTARGTPGEVASPGADVEGLGPPVAPAADFMRSPSQVAWRPPCAAVAAAGCEGTSRFDLLSNAPWNSGSGYPWDVRAGGAVEAAGSSSLMPAGLLVHMDSADAALDRLVAEARGA